MGNPFYVIRGLIRKQTDRQGIGSDMTGEVSRTYMLHWDEEFLNKLKDARKETDLYGRYVDDKSIFVCEINRGWGLNPKR